MLAALDTRLLTTISTSAPISRVTRAMHSGVTSPTGSERVRHGELLLCYVEMAAFAVVCMQCPPCTESNRTPAAVFDQTPVDETVGHAWPDGSLFGTAVPSGPATT